MVQTTLIAIAFAALAAASPHNSHQRFHKHRAVSPLAGRGESYDGSCGSWSGMTCPAGTCCGPNGWCGSGADFCSTGCQVGFGDCGTSSSSPSAAPAPAVDVKVASSLNAPAAAGAVSPNGLCGADNNAWTCQGSNFGDACSKWGYCGSNSSYSGEGCQSAYGTCGDVAPAASAYVPPPAAEMTTVAAASSPSADATSSVDEATLISFANKGHNPQPQQTTMQTLAFPTITLPAYTTQAAPAPGTSSTTAPAYSAPSAAAPSTGSSSSSGTAAPKNYIKMYTGNGSPSAGWPSQDSWLSAADLWSANADVLSQGCSGLGVSSDNSESEIAEIKSAVASVAASSGVDERFIIAIMLQESNGCVRVPMTSYSVKNPGLFQSHEGTGSCNDGVGNIQTPCPYSQIQQMVKDGVQGTASGDGLQQLLASSSASGSQKFYEAARKYNSGSIDPSGNLGLGVATHCYCSDVANRLTGWAEGTSGCSAATVGA